MPTYNYKSRELIAKIVYYGPGRCGKTTNLQQIHARMRPETRSELLSVATETDRTIYFDLLPLNLGTISGMKFMVRLFTVPGQVYYAETRKLVLRGADGIVFVADSQDHMMDENRQSLRDLKDNLAANGIDYNTVPLVLQYNKRDLPRLIPEAELDAALNDRGVKGLSAVASEGTGVLETLRFVTLSVFNHIKAGGKDRPPAGGPSVAVPGGLAPSGVVTPSLPSMPPPPSTPFGGAAGGMPLGGAAGGMSLGGAAGGMSLGGPPPPPGGLAMGAPAPGVAVPGLAQGAPIPGMPTNATPAMGMPRPGNPAMGRGPSAPGEAARPQNPTLPPNGPTAATGPQRPQTNHGRPSSGPPPPPGAPPAGRGPPPPPGATVPGRAPPPPPGPGAPLNPNGPQPVRIGTDIVLDEFKNLALVISQMGERMSELDKEVKRLGREVQEIREERARENER